MTGLRVALARVPARLLVVAAMGAATALVHLVLPRSVLVLLALLASVGLARHVGSAQIAFFVGGLASVVLLDVPLAHYVDRLVRAATQADLVLLFLAITCFALVARLDLQRRADAAADTRAPGAPPAPEERFARVLCVFARLHAGVSSWRSTAARFVAQLGLVLAVFVGSQTSVLLFRSLWGGGRDDVATDPSARALAAGILCVCVAGCLAFSPALGLPSPWWLFYGSTLRQSGLEMLIPPFPAGVLSYALASAVHGIRLAGVAAASRGAAPAVDAETGQRQSLYAWLLAGCLALVVVAAVLRPGPPPGGEHADAAMVIKLRVIAGLVLVAAAVLLAQALLFRDFVRPERADWPVATWEVVRNEMRDAFGAVVSLVIFLAFAWFLSDQLKHLVQQPHGDPLVRLAVEHPSVVPPAAIGVTGVAAWFLGSAWASFALGAALLGLWRPTDADAWIGRALVETLVLVGAFCNQTRPRADNVIAMLGDRDTDALARTVWWGTRSVAGSAFTSQLAIFVAAVAVAWLWHWTVSAGQG